MKKKLLFINGHLNSGGVEKALTDLLNHLDYSRYDVDLLLLEEMGDYVDQIPRQVNIKLKSLRNTYGAFSQCMLRCLRERDWFCLKIRLIFLIMKFFGQAKLRFATRLLTDNVCYDCVVGFRPGICTQIASFATKAKKRVAWWHHGEINVAHNEYLASVVNCDFVVTVSDSCKCMLARAFPSIEQKLVVISNIIDVDSIKRKAALYEPYAEVDVLNIVSVGRLAPEKHFENAIYAASELKKRGVAFKWHLVGDGVLREALLELVEKLNVSDCFDFEGNQPNPYPYVKWADLFVHTSYVESFGLVVAEALVLGLPCVVTKSSGVLEFLQDGDNALLTDQSPEALTEKVIHAVENGAIRDRLRHNTRCPEQFMPSAVIREIEDLLERRL